MILLFNVFYRDFFYFTVPLEVVGSQSFMTFRESLEGNQILDADMRIDLFASFVVVNFYIF